jgi:hypothetical protein
MTSGFSEAVGAVEDTPVCAHSAEQEHARAANVTVPTAIPRRTAANARLIIGTSP